MSYIFLLFPDFKSKAVTLSYDDGVVHDKKLIEIMNKYGLRGTFNINSGKFGNDRLEANEAKELYEGSNNEIGVHGKMHLSLPELHEVLIINEVLEDRKNLEMLTGKIVTGMAYAYGTYNDKVVDILKKCGISYARTVKSTERFDIPKDWLRLEPTCHHSNPRLLELAHEFIEDSSSYWSKRPKLFYLWGHSYEFHNNNNLEVIEDFAKVVGNRDDVWYATNIEVYNYVQAYNRLQFNSLGTLVYNPSSIDVYINYYDRKYCVLSGTTIDISR